MLPPIHEILQQNDNAKEMVKRLSKALIHAEYQFRKIRRMEGDRPAGINAHLALTSMLKILNGEE